MRVLVTGGAGFIGSHVVVAMKSMSPVVHPARARTARTAAAPISMAPRSNRSLSWSMLSFGVKVSGSR